MALTDKSNSFIHDILWGRPEMSAGGWVGFSKDEVRVGSFFRKMSSVDKVQKCLVANWHSDLFENVFEECTEYKCLMVEQFICFYCGVEHLTVV